jgi:CRP/FNR family transcriptional regulator
MGPSIQRAFEEAEVSIPAARIAKPLAAPLHAIAKAAAPGAALNHATDPGARGLGLAFGLGASAVFELDAALGHPIRVKKRAVLFRTGEPLTALYAIRVGTFKSLLLAEDGREQVVAYHMATDVLGLDALGQDLHVSEAIALEDSEVWALAVGKLDEIAQREPSLRRNLLGLLSRAAHGNQEMMLLLGSMHSDERLAGFLLALAERFRCAGYSPTEFMLRMTREEIASYLGLQLETVSRLFSRMHEEGLIQVQGRAVKLLDLSALKTLAGQGP